ncbi:MAG TPA: TRAP transporter substrate-binding protein DctP, partial [Synergistaceae bacterium]|nr:TRAP transporter substrate-binding protein DctP [Synergistaceae bacterium]
LLAYTLQYVVPNYELAKKNYASGTPFADYVAKLYEKQDIKVLAYWPVYFGGIGLLKDPGNAEDPTAQKNLKVRVPTMKTWETLANTFGYQATPLPFSEFFTAAQTGIVNGIFGGGAENYHVSFQDLIKCYVAANTHFECWPFTINLELYESLSDADRELLNAKAKELEERRWATVESDQDKYVDLMEKAGTKVYRLNDEQLKEFARIGREASWNEFKKVIGEKAFNEIVATFVLEYRNGSVKRRAEKPPFFFFKTSQKSERRVFHEENYCNERGKRRTGSGGRLGAARARSRSFRTSFFQNDDRRNSGCGKRHSS